MPRRRLQEVQPGFAAGLVRDPLYFIAGSTYEQPDFLALPETALTAARNCRLMVQGGMQKLHGVRRVHASAIDGGAVLRGGFSWRKGNGTVQQLVTTDNLFTGTYGLPMTWSSQAGALDNTVWHGFAAFRDGTGEVVYIADGGLLNKWNGAAVTTDLASTPSVSRVAVYNQRLFGISGSDENLYWSGLNNGDTLGVSASGGGVAIVRTFGGQNITGLAPVGGSLLIFHANAISRFSGYAQNDIDIDAGAVGHAAEVGTLAPRSIVVVDMDGQDVALFLTKRGLFAAGESSVVPVPTPFDRELASLGAANWTQVHATHHPINREVWFNVTGFIYIYRYDLKAWTGPHAQLFAGAGAPVILWTAEDTLGGPIVLAGGGDGFVRHCDHPDVFLKDVLSDGTGGSAITTVAQLRPWFFGDESLEKLYRHLYITGQSIGGPATVTVDWTTSTGDSGTSVATIPTTYGTVAVPIYGRGTYIRIQLTDGGATPTMIFALRGEAFALGRRR